MKLLAVETSTGCQSVAVMDEHMVLAESHAAAEGHHSKYLVPTIDRVLKAAGNKLSDIQGLAVSIGPGSFTGLRVGLATMMGFRMVTGVPMAAVPTLEAMAWNLRSDKGRLCPILKARTGEVYWALYQWTDEGLTQIGHDRVGSLSALVNSVTESTTVYGEGWQANREELLRLFEASGILVREASVDAMAASAVSVGLAGAEKIRLGDIAGYGLSPRYVQRAEAEIMLERKLTTT